MKTKKYIINILISSFILLISCDKNEDSIALIPHGYTGIIKIKFSQENGTEKEYENGKRLYVIPSDGILRTKFGPQFGIHFSEYYYVLENGQRNKIHPILDLNQQVRDTLKPSKVYAYRFMNLGDGFELDSLGNVTEQNRSEINFTIGYPK